MANTFIRGHELAIAERLPEDVSKGRTLMPKTLAIFVEPANYTLDLIRLVHKPLGLEHVFVKRSSLASFGIDMSDEIVLENMSVWRLLKFCFRALRNYDVFIVNGYSLGACLLFLFLDVLLFKKPYAIDSDTELRIPANPLKRFAKKLLLCFLFSRRYAYGFPGGNYSHRDLFLYYGMGEDHVFLDPMCVDNSRYDRSDLQTKPSRSRKFRFGYLGRIVECKQVREMLDVYVAQNFDAEFILIGDGVLKTQLESRFKDEIAIGHIQFLGRRFGDEKVRLLHSLDCLVLYSSYEPWGLVINEALASGVPVIVSDKVGSRHDLVEGALPTGIVVPYDQPCQLGNAMREMLDECKRMRFAANARLRMEHWNFDYVSVCLKSFLERVS